MQTASEPFQEASVRGFLHRPHEHAGAHGQDGLVLTHGAGASCASPLLIAIADEFCAAGFWVLRFDLPFRQRRAFGPPHPALAAEDRAGIQAAVDCMRSLASNRVFAGGHSYGGRQASMLASETTSFCEALLLLSYPLHPPNKPQQMRTAHFQGLRTPALFVHGTADPFGSVEELRGAIESIPAPTQFEFIDGAGHDLKRGRFDIAASVLRPFAKLVT